MASLDQVLPRNSALPLLLRQPGEFFRLYRLPLCILLVAAIADAVTTTIGMHRYGADTELHLVQRWVVQVAGVSIGMPLAKLIQLGFVLFVAAWWRPWCVWLLVLCSMLYTAAAISNHFLLL